MVNMPEEVAFQPQSLDVLRRRFDGALKVTYCFGRKTKPCSPEKAPCQVFDFHHGLRLVVCFVHRKRKETPILYVAGWFMSQQAYFDAIMELYRNDQLSGVQTKTITNGPLPGKGLYIQANGDQLIDWMQGYFQALCQFPCPLSYKTYEEDSFHWTGPTRPDFLKLRKKSLSLDLRKKSCQ